MRVYLPRVEARLRGITAWWFCRKKGHLHTIPCNELEWDKESWLTIASSHNTWISSYIIQNTLMDRLRSNPNERRQPQMLDPRSSRLGSTTGHLKQKIVTAKVLIKLPLELGCAICAGILGTCIYFGRICESRGLSNLTPARSRLFKLIGRKKV